MTPILITGKTGEKCTSAGNYHCEIHPAVTRMMKVDEIFFQCNPPVVGPAHNTTWEKEATGCSQRKRTTLSFEAVTVSVHVGAISYKGGLRSCRPCVEI